MYFFCTLSTFIISLHFVSFEVKGRLGTTKGRKTFNTFDEAQKFAVKVDKQKSAKLTKWGSTSN